MSTAGGKLSENALLGIVLWTIAIGFCLAYLVMLRELLTVQSEGGVVFAFGTAYPYAMSVVMIVSAAIIHSVLLRQHSAKAKFNVLATYVVMSTLVFAGSFLHAMTRALPDGSSTLLLEQADKAQADERGGRVTGEESK